MRISSFFVGIVLFLMLWSGCYEFQDGCFDLEAVNYNFVVDNNVLEDCEYLEIRVQFIYVYSILDMVYIFWLCDSVYLDEVGNFFMVNVFEFFIFDFELQCIDGAYFNIEEEFDLYLFDNNGNVVL